MGLRATLKDLNHNVRLVFAFSFFQSLGRGVWFGAVFSAYIYFLAGESNTILGWTSVATGVAFTVFLLPAGLLADRFRRDSLLKGASFFGLLAIIIIAWANEILYIMVALVFWGIAQGLTRPSLESIFADSVPSGSRSGIYSQLHMTRNVAMSVGPFLNVVLFTFLGDEWELTILKQVMYVGLVISSFSLVSLLQFSDDETMGDLSEAFEEPEEVEEELEILKVPKLSEKRNFIPTILVISNLVVGLGAGMTIKYFPIYFLDVYKLQPRAVNFILGLTAVATGVTAIYAQRISLARGRVLMIMAVQLLATLCLFFIAFVPPILLLVPLFIARGSLMNAAQPLSRSILMDYVPKKRRGFWNSIEALAWGFFWNFSAVIGGYLIDNFSYQFNFFITAGIYTLGTLILIPLIPLVREEEPISNVVFSDSEDMDYPPKELEKEIVQ